MLFLLFKNVIEDVEILVVWVIVFEWVVECVFVDYGDDLFIVVLYLSCLVVGMGCNKGIEVELLC